MPQAPAFLTKLSVPDAADAVRRERLFRVIETDGPAIWVAAPPGAGKTTLAASYLAATQRPALWYRIDGGDADPAAFFYYLGIAAAKAAPRRRGALPLLTPEYLPDLAGFTRRYFRALFDRLPAGSLLVFDDGHELDGVPMFHEILREALAEIPGGIQLLVLSRAAPPPPLARYLANRRLRLLDWNDLRLTPEETRDMAGSALDADAAHRLHQLADGWAAGVILLRRHGAGAVDKNPGLRSRQAVFDYFIGEIFTQAAPMVREFLVATAFFPDFTTAMAASVANRADAAAMLDDLCRQHCFIDKSGEAEAVYRYHDLFRDFLRAQAGAEIANHRRAAAQILATSGRTLDAVPLALENGDWDVAAGFILANAEPLIVQGRWQTLAGWIDALPQEMRDAAPWLLFWRGIAEFAANPAAARALIERAYSRFLAVGDPMGQLLAAAAVIEANFHEWGDFSVLDKWIGVLESLGGVNAAFPSPDVETRVLTGMLIAIAHRRPVHAETQVLVDRLETLLGADIDPNQKGITAASMLWHIFWLGDFAQIRRVHAIAGRLLAERRMTPINDVLLRIMKAQGEIYLGDNAGAREILDEAEAIALRHGLALARCSYVLPLQAYRRLSFGDLVGAEQVIEEVVKMPFSGPMNASQDQFARSWLALQQGNTRMAGEHIQVAHALAEKSGSFVSRAWTHAGWALVHAAAGDLEVARQHVAASRAIVEGSAAGLLPYHQGLVEAWIALRGGDSATCHERLHESFAHATAHGLANTLHWLPAMMSELCAEALRAGIEPEYARMLIRKRNLPPPEPDSENWPWPLEIRTLGGFEVRRDGKPMVFPRKTPKKPIALLKAIIACGGHDVPEVRLIDALWPDTEADAAGEVLAVNLHRLRKLLGMTEAIVVEGSHVGVNPAVCRVDAWAFERLADDAQKSALAGRREASHKHAEQALALYRGDFLANEPDAAWALATRERLRSRFVQLVAATIKHCCERKECDTAINASLRGIDADNLVETFYQELMRCHHCQGRDAEGLAVYRRMKQTFSVVLGIAPSAASEAVYRTLRGT